MTYAYSENYILVISHDEVVHLKKSMLEKMPGSDEQKFANLKAAYAFMLGHPGKKLLFMGQEFGERREWSEARELDWASLNDPRHEGLKEYVGQLLTMYNKYPHCTAWMIHGMDSSGSMRMMATAAFSALFVIRRASETICCLSSTSRR